MGYRLDPLRLLIALLRITHYIFSTRSTRRTQTSLAEVDYYSQTAQCKNGDGENGDGDGDGGERLTPKVLDHYLHHGLVMLQLLWCFLLIHSS